MSTRKIQLPDWIYRQSAVLPYRQGAKGLEVLLVTSRKGSCWVLPKGIVEPGLTAAESAVKEAREEAGVDGPVGTEDFGRYRYKKWGGTCTVEVFPMEVRSEMDDWPESDMRQREWMTVSEAARRVDKKKLRKIIRRLPDAVDANGVPKPGTAAPSHRHPVATGKPRRLIYLFRHAKSSWADPNLRDFERPLAPRGERALKKMQYYMALADAEPELVLCSPAARTRQTLAGILPALGEDVPVTFDRGLYMLGMRGLLNRLRRVPDDMAAVMLIGHNPGMHALALELVGGGDKTLAQMQANFPTGALATLIWRGRKWSEIGPATCELHSFVVPRQL
ncbi:MAG: NUDIX domain-containing protein [Alphaproteobacteria bacterium]|nr:NUDIX domain-containing protein [Alphaproteobacteria bacterium]